MAVLSYLPDRRVEDRKASMRQRSRAEVMSPFDQNATDRLIALPFVYQDSSANSEILRFAVRGGEVAAAPVVAVMLSQLAHLRTAHEHIETLKSAMTIRCEETEEARALIEKLQSLGAFITLREIIEKCRASEARDVRSSRIQYLCIPTRDRTASLSAAVRSYAANFKSHDHACEVVIFDDSETENTREANRCMLRGAARTVGFSCSYAGPAEKRAYTEMLQRRGVSRSAVEFALGGGSTHEETFGQNRNAILLHTVGSCVLSADDDTKCLPISAQLKRDDRISITGWGDIAEIEFGESAKVLTEYFQPEDIDVVGAHERLLGRTLAHVITTAEASSLDIDEPCWHQASALLNAFGVIGVTLNGSFGDSGTHISPLFNLRPEQVTDDQASCALNSRQVVRAARHLTIAHHAPFFAMFAGLDNRRILPPFLPRYRAEDAVFARCVNLCRNDCFNAHLPFALMHATRDVRRSYEHSYIAQLRVSDYVLACFPSQDADDAEAEENMIRLGNHLCEIARSRPIEFERLLWTRVRPLLKRRLSALEEWNRKCNSHQYLTKTIGPSIQRIENNLKRGEFVIPADSSHPNDRLRALSHIKAIVLAYGSLLMEWPSIIEAAHDLARMGINLASPL